MSKTIGNTFRRCCLQVRILLVRKGIIKTGWAPHRRHWTVLRNAAVKKSVVFATTFAIAGIIMGASLVGNSENTVAAYAMGSIFRTEAQSDAPKTVNLWSQLFWKDTTPEDNDGSGEYEHYDGHEEHDDYIQGFVYLPDVPLSEPLQRYTYEVSSERGLEYDLVLALMWRESRFRIEAINHNTNGTTDSGIMQINDVNRGWLLEKHGIEDLMDPYQNILAGVIMLEQLMKKYDTSHALIAYQYGESGMLRNLEQGTLNHGMITQLRDRQNYYRQLMRQQEEFV